MTFCVRIEIWSLNVLDYDRGYNGNGHTKWTTNSTYLSSQCPLMWTFHNVTLTSQTNMHILPQISHTSTQQWQLLRLAALAMFLQTTRRVWIHSTNSASLASSSQHLSKTSQASAFTHHITSGCVETILCLWLHHISLHHFSPTLRVSSMPQCQLLWEHRAPIDQYCLIMFSFSYLFSIFDLFSWNLAFVSQPCLWS